jgi:hypothetical protein
MGTRVRVLGVAVSAALCVVPAADAAATTAAAKPAATTVKKTDPTKPHTVQLTIGQVKKIGPVTCGRVSRLWQPGVLGKGLTFTTYTAKASAAKAQAKRLKGAKRKARLAKAATYARYAKDGRAVCKLKVPVAAPAPVTPVYAPPAAAAVTPLRFDLSGAIGLASRGSGPGFRSATVAGSNLAVVDRSGRLRDAVVSGQVTINHFLIAPNDKLYVLFASATAIDPAHPSVYCLLAEVDPATGLPTCIDSTLSYIYWADDSSSRNPAIQFDGNGAIYYTGQTSTGHTVLRRFSGGVVTDLVTDNVALNEFVVLKDGTVILSGTTNGTGAQWTRRLSPQGALRTLKTQAASFLRLFPDGNAYMGLSYDDYGVDRYLAAGDDLDPAQWIGRNNSYAGSTAVAPHFDLDALCGSSWGAFCSSSGTYISKSFTTSDDRVFVIAGSSPNGELVQYFPAVARATTDVTKTTVAEAAGTGIALSGLDASNHNITTIYDPSTGSARTLVPADNEIEMYHLDYVPTGNLVLFDGLRFADNTYVLGQIQLDTGAVTVTARPSVRLTGLATFG